MNSLALFLTRALVVLPILVPALCPPVRAQTRHFSSVSQLKAFIARSNAEAAAAAASTPADSGKKKGRTDYYHALLYRLSLRAFPGDAINAAAYARAAAQRADASRLHRRPRGRTQRARH